MEIRVLNYFVETANQNSMTKAARRLHVTQPTLSKQLKDLEDELGQKLFIRSNYSVKLTSEGELLYKRAVDILSMVNKIENEFKSMNNFNGGDLHIGCAESYGITLVAKAVKSLTDKYSNIKFHLFIISRQGFSDEMPNELKNIKSTMNIVGTYDLLYNASIFVKEGLGYAFCLDKLIDTSKESDLLFKEISPHISSPMKIIWPSKTILSKTAELFLEELKKSLS